MALQDGPTEVERGSQEADTGASLSRKLAGIDLNLLVVLEALLICRNVTHAARRIGQTQPAVSRSLARLRSILGDDLLVRSSTGLKLTTHGEYLAGIVPATMSHVREVIAARDANIGIRVSISTHLMPALVPRFMQSGLAGNLPVKIGSYKSHDEGIIQLRSRSAQFLVGAVGEDREGICRESILSEDFVTLIACERHKLGGIRPSEAAFLQLLHVNLIQNGAEVFPQVAETLQKHGVKRSHLVEVPDVTSAGMMASESGLALTVPRSIASWLAKTLPLSAILPPIAVPPQEIAAFWLAAEADSTWGRLVEGIRIAAKEAIASEYASIRGLRLISAEAQADV